MKLTLDGGSQGHRFGWIALPFAAALLLSGQALQASAVDSVIAIVGNDCFTNVDVCFFAHQDFLPLADYSQQTPGVRPWVEQAAITGNGIKASLDTKSQGDFSFSWFDTYTLDGPANLIGTQTTVIPDFSVTGTMVKNLFVPGCFLAFGGVTIKEGSWNAAATDENLRVSPQSSASQQFAGGCEATQNIIPVNIHAFGPLTVTYGTPFDVAYQMQLDIGAGAASLDFMHTGVVSFTIPDGSTLTSVRGFAAGTAVPEPATWFGVALALLAVVGGRSRLGQTR